jgi:hypothetical protein
VRQIMIWANITCDKHEESSVISTISREKLIWTNHINWSVQCNFLSFHHDVSKYFVFRNYNSRGQIFNTVSFWSKFFDHLVVIYFWFANIYIYLKMQNNRCQHMHTLCRANLFCGLLDLKLWCNYCDLSFISQKKIG